MSGGHSRATHQSCVVIQQLLKKILFSELLPNREMFNTVISGLFASYRILNG
jgi:hypothetical protein